MFGQASQNSNKTVCQFYQRGNCKYGSNCFNLHPGAPGTASGNVFGRSTSTSSLGYNSFDKSNATQDNQFAEFVKQINTEMNMWEANGLWKLSCLAPLKEHPPIAEFIDTSPEELRVEAYEALKANNSAAYQASYDSKIEYQKQLRQAMKNRHPEAIEVLKKVYYKSGSNDTSAATSNSLFGKASASFLGNSSSQTSVFGGNNTANKTASVFGGTPNVGSNNIFGAKPQPSAFGAAPVFGSNSSFGGNSTFKSTFGGNQSSMFGGEANKEPSQSNFNTQQNQGIFGASVNSSSNVFGTNSSNTGSSNIFGTSTSTSNSNNGFGTNTSTSTSNSIFGTNALGGGSNSSFGSSSLGSGANSTFGMNANASNSNGMFGTNSGSNGIFGNNTNNSGSNGIFGTNTNSGNSMFGANTNNSGSNGIFGANSNGSNAIFGTNATANNSNVLFGTDSSGSNGVFGASQSTSGSNAIFGSNPNTNGSGSSGIFGTTPNTNGSSGIFGTNANTGSSSGIFGTNANTSGSSGIFGTNSSAPNVFGTDNNVSQNSSVSFENGSQSTSMPNSFAGGATQQQNFGSTAFGTQNLFNNQGTSNAFAGGTNPVSQPPPFGNPPQGNDNQSNNFGGSLPTKNIFGLGGSDQISNNGAVFGNNTDMNDQNQQIAPTAPTVVGSNNESSGIFGNTNTTNVNALGQVTSNFENPSIVSNSTNNQNASTANNIFGGNKTINPTTSIFSSQSLPANNTRPSNNNNLFGPTSSTAPTGSVNDLIYTPMHLLSIEDKNEFERDVFLRIPLMPPPRELCF